MKYLVLIISSVFILSCGNQSKNDNEGDIEKPKLAIDILNAEIEKAPLEAEGYYKRGLFYSKNDKRVSATNDLSKAISLDSTFIDAYLALADLSFTANNTSETNRLFLLALSFDSLHVNTNLKMAELHLYIGEYEKTINYVNVALKVDESNAKGYFLKGMAYKYSGNKTIANSSFQTTIEQDPDYYNAFIQLGLMAAEEEDPIAVTYYQNALKINPNSTEALYNMGYYLQSQNDTTGAVLAYETILKINPNYSNAHYNLGYIELVMKNRPVSARNYFQEVLNIERVNSRALYMVGRTFELEGNKEQAKDYYQQTLDINPKYSLAKEGMKRI